MDAFSLAASPYFRRISVALCTDIAAWLLDSETGKYDKLDPISSMTGEAYCRGVLCKAEEAYFGGIVVTAELPDLSA